MASTYTAISDIVDPEVLADQVSAKFPDMLVIGNSNFVQVDTDFPLGSPGTKFTIPSWKRIGAFGDLTEGTAMDTGKIQTLTETATVVRGGAAFEVTDQASLVSKSDPVGEIANQISRRAAEYIDGKLVAQANHTPNSFDQSIGANKTNANGTFDQKTAITAMIGTLGDNYSRLISGGAFIVMHSKVLGDLITTDAIQNRYQSGSDVMLTGQLPTLNGLPVVSSDLVTSTTQSGANLYTTFIIGRDALMLFYQRQAQVEFDRDILKLADIVSANVNFAPHLGGWDDTTSAFVWEQNKSCACVRITSY